MAEGGGYFGRENPDLDYNIDHDGGDPHNTTKPFQPGHASTPRTGFEEHIPLATFPQEHGRLPDTSFEENSFGGERDPLIEKEDPVYVEIKRRWLALKFDDNTGIVDTSMEIPNLKEETFPDDFVKGQKKAISFIKRRYPQFNEKDLVIGFSRKNPLALVVKGLKGGETPIFLKDGSHFQRYFLNLTYVKNALGRPAESIIKQTSDDIRKQQKKVNEMRQEQKRYHERKEEKEKEVLDLQMRLRSEVEKQQQLQDDPAADKKVLKQKETLVKNLEKDLKTKQKENAQLKKNYEDSQKKTQKISQLQSSILQEERTRDSLEARFNSTCSFDALKEQESGLLRQTKEDQAIIDDKDAAEFDKEAAEEHIATRNEELARLQTQIAEREAAMPLRESIKEIL